MNSSIQEKIAMMVNPSNNNQRSSSSSSSSNSRRSGRSKQRTLFIIVSTAIPSFVLGFLVALNYAGVLLHNDGSDCRTSEKLQLLQSPPQKQQIQKQQQQQRIEKEEKEDVPACKEHQQEVNSDSKSSSTELFPKEGFGRHIVSMSTVDKEDFIRVVDPGVPVDPPSKGANDVLILYASGKALPKSMKTSGINSNNNNNPKLSMVEAVQNCNQLNVILNDHSGFRSQCIAIVPQYESYHIQKWMRVSTDKNADKSLIPLELYSRGQIETGRNAFKPPKTDATRQHWQLLKTFLANVDDVLADLKPILERIARNNAVVVLVCNFGQSELMMNFVCAAKSRGFDLSNVIVFATDTETHAIAEGLGLTAYYDYRNFADIPEGAARRYGDPKFVAMMMAKVLCVLYVSWSGYDMLFQDVDIIWYKNPLDYFANSNATQHDIFFQDDGGHSLRYSPYSANSGFYFVRYNDRTRHFLTAILMAGGGMVIQTKSHQQALIALLQEHVSLHGLKAKVLSRDMEEFPGGYQYNQKSGKYMRAFYAGKLHPYIFHMSWTLNKNNKLLYFRQMGEWYVKDMCIAKKRSEIISTNDTTTDLKPLCCSAEPLISCHYRDKPSKIPCKDSPPIDKGRPSWWK